MKVKITVLLLSVLLTLSILVLSLGALAQENQELTKVRVGVTPYSMWQIW
ncbi:MAG: hypothetical protein GX421_09210, partial [Caldisericales bacterium]|nr:hypothetical protein [Caldisericales bacterium]